MPAAIRFCDGAAWSEAVTNSNQSRDFQPISCASWRVEILTDAGWERWDWPCADYREAQECARDVSREWGFACRIVRPKS